MLESIFNDSMITTNISIFSCLICMIVAIVLGAIISITYKITTKTTPQFLLTLTILPVLVQVVILLINGNLGTSVAVAGAFALVRFRSLPGNSKEIICVFWAMAIGLALGMGYVVFAIMVTVIVAGLVLILNKCVLKENTSNQRKLKIIIPEDLDYEEVFEDILKKYTEKAELMKVKTTNMGSMYELSYRVKLNKEIASKKLIDEIRCRNGNLLVMLEREELSEVEL